MLVIDESTINLTRNDDSKMRISNKIFNECLCQNDKKKKKNLFSTKKCWIVKCESVLLHFTQDVGA